MATPEREIDKILNLEGPDNPPAPGAPSSTDVPPGPDSKPSVDPKKLDEALEQNKNLQEKIRQITEDTKKYAEFYDKVTGADETKKKLVEQQQKLKDFEENPLATIQEVESLKNTVAALETKLISQNQVSVVDRLMREIDLDFDVDWSGKGKEIAERLRGFSSKKKEENLKQCLIDAARLTMAIKKKDTPNSIENHRAGQKPATQTEIEAEQKRLDDNLNNVGRKKKNVFNI
jgi:hypothetical protein